MDIFKPNTSGDPLRGAAHWRAPSRTTYLHPFLFGGWCCIGSVQQNVHLHLDQSQELRRFFPELFKSSSGLKMPSINLRVKICQCCMKLVSVAPKFPKSLCRFKHSNALSQMITSAGLHAHNDNNIMLMLSRYNVYHLATIFHGNQSNCCQEVLLKTKM